MNRYGSITEGSGAGEAGAKAGGSRRGPFGSAARIGGAVVAVLCGTALSVRVAMGTEALQTTFAESTVAEAPGCLGCEMDSGEACVPCVVDGDCSNPQLPAVLGYDVVSFRNAAAGECGATGSAEFAAAFAGYWWWFASQANLDAFLVNPESFAPAYGGYCAFGIATEKAWSATNMGPPVTIFSDESCATSFYVSSAGTLYLFNGGVMDKFKEQEDHYATMADARWAEWFEGTGPYNTDSYSVINAQCVDSEVGNCCSCNTEMGYDCPLEGAVPVAPPAETSPTLRPGATKDNAFPAPSSKNDPDQEAPPATPPVAPAPPQGAAPEPSSPATPPVV